MPKVDRVELDGNREYAVCCGTNAWLNCDMYSKRMQMQRIQDGIDKGAKVLTVACPKCEIHFKCTMNEKSKTMKKKIDVQYFTNLLRIKETS